jgi:glycerophosphoryl diester phosphodiesterase
MLRDILDHYRSALRRLAALLAVHAGVRLFIAALLLPLAALVLGLALRRSGQSAVADQDIARFLGWRAG